MRLTPIQKLILWAVLIYASWLFVAVIVSAVRAVF